MEISFVTVPANAEALVVQRSLSQATKADAADWKCGASRNLPVNEDLSWDGPAAAASIFEKAGFDGDSPDVTFARKGFLAYDAANPKLKGSYKLPFAKVIDGRLTALKSGVNAASTRISGTDIPSDVKDKAQAVIDSYKAKWKDDGKMTTPKIKGLFQVAWLCQVLNDLGAVQSMSEFEEAIEEDGSQVPEMLRDAMRQVGAALIAMAAEEVSELIDDTDTDGMSDADAAYVTAAKTPVTKALRAARVAKAGRAISAANEETLRQGCKSIMDGHTKCKDGHAMIKDGHDMIMGVIETGGGESGDDQTAGDTDDTNDKAAAAAKRKRELEFRQRQAAV
jgi:hypothetical protein